MAMALDLGEPAEPFINNRLMLARVAGTAVGLRGRLASQGGVAVIAAGWAELFARREVK